MTDTIVPPEVELASESDITPQSDARGTPLGELDELAARARAWFIAADEHPLWVEYRREAKEDMGFYIGGKYQWSINGSLEEYERLVAKRRTVVSINHCQSIVDVMAGFERQNRMDIKASPQGDEDAEGAQLMTWLLKFVQEQTSCQDHISELFEDGTICGMDCLEVGVDYSERPDKGQIFTARCTPGKDIIWDPCWLDYDLSDAINGARFVIKWKWAWVADVVARHQKYEREIHAAINDLQQAMDAWHHTQDSANPGDNYGSVRSHPVTDGQLERIFFDPEDNRVMVMEVWYRTYEDVYLVVDKLTGRVTEATTWAAATELAATDKPRLRAVTRTVRKVRTATILPATYHVLEEGPTPYENDEAHYPFVVYRAKRKGDDIYGVIRNLKDPQRVENKRISQVLDILGRYANLRPLVPKGSLPDPNVVTDNASTAPIVYDPEKGAPTWFTPPLAELARVLTELALQMKINIREVSGVNTELLGLTDDNKSGVAIARRQAQGQVITTLFFDNLRRTRKLIGQRLARRIQQVFTGEEVLRLTNDVGKPVAVMLNPPAWSTRETKTDEERAQLREEFSAYADSQRQLGRPHILRSVQALKYDIVISESPSTPTARATALLALLEIVEKMPMIAPALLDVIVELADIPDRPRVLERVSRLIPPELTGQPPGGGPPALPPAGGAPPGPPAATPPAMAA